MKKNFKRINFHNMQSRFFILKIKINTFYNKQNIFYVINFF